MIGYRLDVDRLHCCFGLRMSVLRFTSVVFRNPLLFRQVLLARAIIGHGFATQKAKAAEVPSLYKQKSIGRQLQNGVYYKMKSKMALFLNTPTEHPDSLQDTSQI